MPIWHSNLIHIDGLDVQAHAGVEGVTFGKMVDGVYASDLLMTPDQAQQVIDGLTAAKAKCLEARGQS